MNGNNSIRNYSHRRENANSINNINKNCWNRKRKVIGFKHLFCKLSIVNTWKYFLNLFNENIHWENSLNEIFNWNTAKLVTNDISKIMYNHYRKIIDKSHFTDKQTHTSLCNCRIIEEWPMCGKYNSENIVYQANIFIMESNNDQKVYTGRSTFNYKQRSYNHKPFFLLIHRLRIKQLYLCIIGA